MPIIETVVKQHAEESAFLWLLRDRAVHAPHYSLKDMAKLDNRLDAHIDGLRVAGDAGWEICKEAMSAGESGEVFAAAVLAFESGDAARIQMVLEVAEEKLDTCRGLVSTLGWLTWQQAEVHIAKLLADGSPLFRYLGLAACAAHRQDPGSALTDALRDETPIIKARALQSAGELGNKDLLAFIQDNMKEPDDFCRYSAACSAALLGDAESAAVLKSFVRADFPWPEDALIIAMRRMTPAAAIDWQAAELAKQPGTLRLAIIGAGAIGDPTLAPWLMEQMAVQKLARVAGEAFTMISGLDIAYADLEGERPEGFESGPTENPEDEDVEMDPDEDLPWPDPELIRTWWEKNKSRFRNGARYLLGQPITYEHMEHVLRTGRQRQRHAAALEMSMLKTGLPLFEVRAPGFRQQQMLGLK
jgi:uncharacterized protein (TIGR02270 family)